MIEQYKGSYFKNICLYARNANRQDDDPQVRLVLIDQYNFTYLLNEVHLQKFAKMQSCDEYMSDGGFVKFDDAILQVGDIDLEFGDFSVFVEKERNFPVGETVEFIYEFFNLLNVRRWQTPDGLKWFLKGMIGIANGNNRVRQANQ